MKEKKQERLKLALPLSNNLRAIRTQCGITRTRLARECGLVPETIRYMELGKRPGKQENRYNVLNTINRLCGKEYKLEDIWAD